MNYFCCNLKHFNFVQKQHSCTNVFLVGYVSGINGISTASISTVSISKWNQDCLTMFTYSLQHDPMKMCLVLQQETEEKWNKSTKTSNWISRLKIWSRVISDWNQIHLIWKHLYCSYRTPQTILTSGLILMVWYNFFIICLSVSQNSIFSVPLNDEAQMHQLKAPGLSKSF